MTINQRALQRRRFDDHVPTDGGAIGFNQRARERTYTSPRSRPATRICLPETLTYSMVDASRRGEIRHRTARTGALTFVSGADFRIPASRYSAPTTSTTSVVSGQRRDDLPNTLMSPMPSPNAAANAGRRERGQWHGGWRNRTGV